MASRYALYGLAALGTCTALYQTIRTAYFIRNNYLTHADLKKRYGKAGSWAVITGGSDGIGRAMALDLAKRGFNVCVIARSQSKLDEVVESAKAFGVQAMSIVFDFAKTTEQAYASLFAQLDDLDMAILINNVGIGYHGPSHTASKTAEQDRDLLIVNCDSAVCMTRYAVPRFKEKKCGAIIFLSSFSGVFSVPFMSMYAGTKAFIRAYGDCLSYELQDDGIDVMTVMPTTVISSMTTYVGGAAPKTTFYLVDAAIMAHQTLDQLGTVRETAGHRNHGLLYFVYDSLPRWYVSNRRYKFLKGIMKKREASA